MEKIGAPNNLIYLCYRGSITYNTYVHNVDINKASDVDILGVFMAPKEYYIGLDSNKKFTPTTITIKEQVGDIQYDCVFYEIRHFVDMILKCNPNVITALWIKPTHAILSSIPFGQFLINKSSFISKKLIYRSFTGYANGQMHEIQKALVNNRSSKKRKDIIEKCGYDTKHAASMAHSLHVVLEALQVGKLNVFRYNDADQLIDIKLGKWSKDELISYTEEMLCKIDKAYEKSTIRELVDMDLAEKILMDILKKHITK